MKEGRLARNESLNSVMEDLFETVYEFTNIEKKDILGKSRVGEITEAKRVIMGILSEEGLMVGPHEMQPAKRISITELAEYFNRDHSSLIHNRDSHYELYAVDKSYKKFFDNIYINFKLKQASNELNVNFISFKVIKKETLKNYFFLNEILYKNEDKEVVTYIETTLIPFTMNEVYSIIKNKKFTAIEEKDLMTEL